MNSNPEFSPVCALCGDRIGVYEPLLLRTADGAIVATTVLELRDRSRSHAHTGMFHRDCLSLAHQPPLRGT
jgi:hypothetical protein